jgi:hypothetical protein
MPVTWRWLWRADDRSGVEVQHYDPAGVMTTPGTAPGRQKVTHRWASGGILTVVDTLPPARAAVCERLDSGRAPAQRLHTIGELAFWHPDLLASVQVRRAVLSCLAHTAGLSAQPATDRFGRTGLAVTGRHQATQMTVLFDPTTGHVLAYEAIDLPPAAPDGPRVAHNLLIVQTGRRDNIPALDS